MATINPYLNFNGNTEAAFYFYKSVLGGTFTTFQEFKDIPDIPGGNLMSESDKEKIMHVALPIGKGNVLMATDVLESLGHPKAAGNLTGQVHRSASHR
jgi:PhnB protein